MTARRRTIALGARVICLALVVATSCMFSTQPDSVQVRVQNVSTVRYDSVNLMSRELGTVSPGDFTRYEKFDRAYHYGYVRLFVDGNQRELIPIDFVGETPLRNGRYTYRVGLSTSGLILDFVVDQQ